jgi:hypothetical protein
MRITGLLVGMMLIVAFDSRAEFYKYKDNSGAIVITDKLENVPPKYRKQFKVVWDADLEKKDPLAMRKAKDKALQEKQEQEQELKQRKTAEKKKPGDGKRVVITVDENTGQLIRTFE